MKEHGLTKRQVVYLFFKRLLDIIFSFIGIIILIPIFILVSILVKCTSKGPILYLQYRTGKNKKEFRIIKFRTMKKDAPELPAIDLTDSEQKKILTCVGGFLRQTSIDELPQVFNILVGQMSFIGPRPAMIVNHDGVVDERDKYVPSPNALRPGLSGYAQTHGRNHEVKLKAELDYYYAKNLSFKLDVIIFFLTIKKLFLFNGR
jgi:O-antigen biosynthesis protein WbqP